MFKKNQGGKRVLSLILALMLIIGQIPLASFASSSGSEELDLMEIFALQVNIMDDEVYIAGFKEDIDLEEVYIPGEFNGLKVVNILDYAFEGKNIKKIEIEEGLESIGESAFEGNNIKSVCLPKSLKKIEKNAFKNNKIKELNLSENIEYIGDQAFANNLIEEVNLNLGKLELGNFVFIKNKDKSEEDYILTKVYSENELDEVQLGAILNPARLEVIHNLENEMKEVYVGENKKDYKIDENFFDNFKDNLSAYYHVGDKVVVESLELEGYSPLNSKEILLNKKDNKVELKYSPVKELNIQYGGVKDGDKFVSQNIQFAVETDQGEIKEVLGNNEALEDITDSIPSSPGQPNFPGRVFIMPLEEGENTIEVKVKLGDRILSDKITVHKENRSLEEFLDDTLSYMYRTTPNPRFGTGGGEWTILSLARGRYEVDDDYYNKYYENVKSDIKKVLNNGKLDRNKGTEHSRLILGFTAAGLDPRDIDGFNALEALADFNYVKRQGINGSIFALIAFDSGDYDIPTLPADSKGTQTTREILIDEILSREIKDTGGWALGFSPKKADVDITSMAIQALAPYYNEREDVKKAVDKALEWLSEVQRGDGSYFSWGANNAESTAQVIVALGELANYGVDIDMDKFTKNDNTVIDGLMEFSVHGGGFMHVKAGPDASGGSGIAGEVNGMATDQGTYALVSYLRMQDKLPSLYNMTDVDKSPGTDKYKDSEQVDKTKLKETIDRLEKLTLDDYTDQTSNQLKEALKEAKIILTDEKASQIIVDEKVKTLLELEKKLEKKQEEKPTEPEDKPTGQEEKYDGYVTLSIDKDTINYPTTLKPVKVGFYKGESVWDVLKREMDERGIAYEYEWTEKYGSVYVQWIDGDGEFDHGEGSGWMYNVNGWYPNYGASKYILEDGDVVQWRYTTDLGADLGEDLSKWPDPDEEDPKDKEDSQGNTPGEKVENLELKAILTSIKKSSNRAVDVLNGISKLNKLLSSEDFKESSKLSNKDIENIFISLDKGHKKIESKKDKKEFNRKVLETSELVLDLINKKQYKVVEENLNLALILNDDGSLDLNVIKLLEKIKADNLNFKTKEVSLSNNFIELAKDKEISKLNIETDTIKIRININDLENKDMKLGLEEGEEASLIIEQEGKKLDKLNSLIKVTIKSDKLNANSIIENQDGENLGGLYNKDSKSISFITKSLGKYSIALNKKTFKDLEDNWAKQEVEKLSSAGFIKGKAENSFKGKDNITRAEFITMINRILELEEGHAVDFKDVEKNKWYYDEVNKAHSSGLVKGVGDKLFRPEDCIDRESIAQVLGNVLTKLGYTAEENGNLSSFEDRSEVSKWSKDNMNLLIELGILKGSEKNELRPKSLATREEAAVLIYRFYEFITYNY